MARSDRKCRDRLSYLEWEARTHPRRHALRLLALVLVGYLYPSVLVLGSFALAVVLFSLAPLAWEAADFRLTIFYGMVVLASLALVAAILRTFWITLPELSGHALQPTDAPALRRLVEDIRRLVGSPPAHHIRLGITLNASVWQRPRFGFWGPRTNYLSIGLPLLIALTPDQLGVVLAHEFGHLRGQHSRFNAWIYRVNATWESLAAPFKNRGWLGWIVMGWFVQWYGHYFALSTLALRRLHEYEADRRGADLCGDAAAAATLLTIDWANYRIGTLFWPSVIREAGREPLPPADVFGRMEQFLATVPQAAMIHRWRSREFHASTPITAEHPCLADRLEALGWRSLLETPVGVGSGPLTVPKADSQAVRLLGDCLQGHWRVANAAWKATAIERWRIEHAAARQMMEKAGAAAQNDTPPVLPDRQWEQIQARAEYAPLDQAMELLQEFLSHFPEHAGANFTLGRLMLDQDDDGGVTYLETAMRHGSDYIGPSLQMLLGRYRDAGRDQEADSIRLRLDQFQQAMGKARKERIQVSRRDRLEAHDLSAEQVASICRILYRNPRIRAAYLARKQVRLFSDKPSYVLGVVRVTHLLEDNRRADKYLVASLGAQVEQSCAVVILGWRNAGLASRLRRVCPAPIFVAAD